MKVWPVLTGHKGLPVGCIACWAMHCTVFGRYDQYWQTAYPKKSDLEYKKNIILFFYLG